MRVFVYIKGKRPASCEDSASLGWCWRRALFGHRALLDQVTRLAERADVVAGDQAGHDAVVRGFAKAHQASGRRAGVVLPYPQVAGVVCPNDGRVDDDVVLGHGVGLNLAVATGGEQGSDAQNSNEKNFLHGFILPNSH